MKTKIINYNITTDSQFLEGQQSITPELSSELEKFHQLALEGKRSSIPKLLKAIEKYPKNPQLKNYLSVLYGQLNETQKMYDVNHWIIEEHPNYLFGKINLANEYYLKQEYDKMPEVLGHDMEIQSLYPERDTFHINEVTSFLKCVTLYFIAIGDIEQAEIRYNLIKEIAPESSDIEILRNNLFFSKMKAGYERYKEEQKNKISVSVNSQEVNNIKESPKFNHDEINALYCKGLYIEKDKLNDILELPRKTLIHDLELVLKDSINRYSYFKVKVEEEGWEEEKMNFVIHAFYLLGELEASESMHVILEVFSQSDEYIDLYFGDFITAMLWEPLLKMSTDNLENWKEFMYKPGIDTYAKVNFTDAMEQIALHYPERREEVLNWFRDVIEFFLNATFEQNVIDSDLIGFIICNVMDINGTELLPEIKKLFDRRIVSTGICGTWADVKESFNQPQNFNKKKEILSIYDLYDKVISTWSGYREEDSNSGFDYSNLLKPKLEPIKVGRKIGRNDPCPCGSGKKYKKCCLN